MITRTGRYTDYVVLEDCTITAYESEKHKLGRRCDFGHLICFRSAKDTNLLPVTCLCIPLSDCRDRVENVAANQRLRRPSGFPDRPEKPHS